MLCDDYNARVAAKNRNVEPVSAHKLIHLMIRQGKITAAEAAAFADALHKAGRHQGLHDVRTRGGSARPCRAALTTLISPQAGGPQPADLPLPLGATRLVSSTTYSGLDSSRAVESLA